MKRVLVGVGLLLGMWGVWEVCPYMPQLGNWACHFVFPFLLTLLVCGVMRIEARYWLAALLGLAIVWELYEWINVNVLWEASVDVLFGMVGGFTAVVALIMQRQSESY